MASWHHLALGAVAAAGVGLALYHAKHNKTEERLEEERTQLYSNVRNGSARFIYRMTDVHKTKDKWRHMDAYERYATLFIDREELAQSYTKKLRDITGKSIPHPVYVSDYIISRATSALKISLECGNPVITIPSTNQPSEVLAYRTVVEQLESQLDDGLTVPMMQFRKALMNWQLLQALQVVRSTLSLKRVLIIYFHLIFLWFGLGMLDHVTGSRFNIFGIPTQLWKLSGGSFISYCLPNLGIIAQMEYWWSSIEQILTTSSLGKMTKNSIDSHVVEFIVLFLAQYIFINRMGLGISFLCTLCEFLFAQQLHLFWFLLWIIWFGMFIAGLYYTLVITIKLLLTVLSSWHEAGEIIAHQNRPIPPFVLQEWESTTQNRFVPLEFPVGFQDDHENLYDRNMNGNSFHSPPSLQKTDSDAIEFHFLQGISFPCSYCQKKLKLGHHVKVCSGCKKRHYCSKRCEDYDWIAHKANCSKKRRKRRHHKNK